MLQLVGQGNRRARVPKQIYPKLIELEYAKALVGHLNVARSALAPLEHELPSLLARAHGDHFDAGESSRARDLINRARDALNRATQPTQIESLAQQFGQRTQQYNRVQLGR